MAKEKPGIPQGTRDFLPKQVIRRNYIFQTIRNVFETFGYQPIETPALEKLSTLTGKYGDEGDQLMFKVLNNGDFLKNVDHALLENHKKLAFEICDRALRYDLTVPFARFVVMHQQDISFPFRRYQMQPVWRGDSPQFGRYREFWQCDADVVGSDSLVFEAEFVLMYKKIFENLGFQNFQINFNNRKILSGISEVLGAAEQFSSFCVAIDKLDKIGWEGVRKELSAKSFSDEQIQKAEQIFSLSGNNQDKLNQLEQNLKGSEIGLKGIEELREVLNILEKMKMDVPELQLDLTLARGLTYYTGAIFEVRLLDVKMGSVGGGGRYDNLTGIFGLDGMSGVGISVGVDRVYDAMETLQLFNHLPTLQTKVIVCHFDSESMDFGLSVLAQLREAGISSEIYPQTAKIKKQMEYAGKKNIPFVIIIGSNEMQTGNLILKNMVEGSQQELNISQIMEVLS